MTRAILAATLLLAQVHALPVARGYTWHVGVARGAMVLHVPTRVRT